MSKLQKAAEQARAALANARDYIYLLETGDVSWSEESQLQEIKAAIFALKKALADPEQEPKFEFPPGFEFQPAFVPRKPLTDAEIQVIWAKTFEMGSSANTFARAIERAHGITGEET